MEASKQFIAHQIYAIALLCVVLIWLVLIANRDSCLMTAFCGVIYSFNTLPKDVTQTSTHGEFKNEFFDLEL